MADKKVQQIKGFVTWSEVRNLVYFASVLIAVVTYGNNMSNKIDSTIQKVDAANARLNDHDGKLTTLATDYDLTNDRLTKIETTLQINQEEGRISAAKKTIKDMTTLALASEQQTAGQSATPVPTPTQNNTFTSTSVSNTYVFPTAAPQPTSQPSPAPQPTTVPALQQVTSGILGIIGL